SEGVRYGVIQTPEKYWLRWKEQDAHPAAGDSPLLRELWQLCRKERLLELIHDFVIFDSGVKKAARHNQYFGVKAAQDKVRRREGGIIWHTQGSGKSLTMVWLARWIREHIENARVLVITDRTELDEQIEKVFKGVDEDIYRTKSGADLVNQLASPEKWLLCSLVHKFGRSADDLSEQDVDHYVEEIRKSLPAGWAPAGNLFVFVDECHRTQSGKLHRAMKALLPDATFIGFTGTPLLKKDKATSVEVFGPYIHTYKFDEAVQDGVVLDLLYEARDIDQQLTSPERVDEWFERKTQGMNDFAKAKLKKRWATMRAVLSSKDRLEKIVDDILLDMERYPRLKEGRGNAMLVTDSIYNACRIYEMFQQTELKGKCAIVTSYRPSPDDIKGEESGEGLTERLLQYNIYRKMLAEWFDEPEDKAMYKTDEFETQVKKRFIEEPGQMKLLIVVDKLLTGFDAPPATYLYIDKPMRDHGLFQAICRVNRLHTEDKDYGYIIDYRDLFQSLQKSIKDYTSGAFEGYDKADVEGLLKDRLAQGRKDLEEVREQLRALCEPVTQPRELPDYLHYFCTKEPGNAEQLKGNEQKRVQLYKLVGKLQRTFAAIANELPQAGYTPDQIEALRDEVKHYTELRDAIQHASGDYVDLKRFEPAMRHLIDTYIRAEASKELAAFDERGLLELIVGQGPDEAISHLPEAIRKSREAVAETIENNVRRLIIDKEALNPAYYERMSQLLEELIEQRRRQALEYAEYLRRIAELARQVQQPQADRYPSELNTPALRALYDNLEGLPFRSDMAAEGSGQPTTDTGSLSYRAAAPQTDKRLALALALDRQVREAAQDRWRENKMRKKLVRRAIEGALNAYLADVSEELVDRLLELIANQDEY
ncbi:MAG: HsdR family type I site-specific deoxyribonuclease, partial [Gammaproteobacteria bacterium]